VVIALPKYNVVHQQIKTECIYNYYGQYLSPEF